MGAKIATGYVDVFCLVLPTGETLWGEARGSTGKYRESYVKATLDKWKSEHVEFINTPCNVAVAFITMPKDKYIAIGANFGGGAFDFPDEAGIGEVTNG